MNRGRLRLISGAIRIIFGVQYPYPDFTQIIGLRRILTKFGAETAPTTGKS